MAKPDGGDILVMMKLRTILFLLVLSATPALFTSSPAQTQMEMNREAAAGFAQADNQLNEIYEEAMRNLSPERQLLLRDAQRAWLKYREAAAKSAGAGFEGGTMQPYIISTTKTEMTKFRIQQIQNLTKP
ncbi:MAG: lysozyme inhibitor LprI family protein [Verrucomicrobiota bacterium]